ncbi:MAG: hypothetical protein GYA50_07155 [Eubacteriaceae bacterium]|nr:hypothetical protein [Eubacteriaceae bacterium]
MNEILWFINENNVNITYKNKIKSVLNKLSSNTSSYKKYAIKNKSDRQIGYACIYKERYSSNKQEQFEYLKDIIIKAYEETGIRYFSLYGSDPEIAAYVHNYFKDYYISGAELMCEIFLMNLNNTYFSNKICFVIDGYISLLKYYKIFDLFCEASIICDNVKAFDTITKEIYLQTATSVYLSNNPGIIKQSDIVFFASANKNYIKYLNPDNIVLDIIDIIGDDYKSIKLIKPPKFMDFYENRISGVFLSDMKLNVSCAQSLLYVLNIDLNKYDSELKLI